jgi:2-(1,2-epoxy-1,2-dihydrophenyl)acetyl-CoA isomerase
MYKTILFNNADGVCTITLNRPAVFHALNADLILEITDAIRQIEKDDMVRVVVITATGDKAFCSGADLKASLDGGNSGNLGDTLEKTYNPMIRAIRNLEKPVICKLNGVAAGAGCSLALACDVIIASADAYLSVLFVGIGLMPDAGLNFFLPRLVGQQKAFELASTGRKVLMPEALQLGMVNQVVAFEDLDNAVAESLAYYKNAPTKAIGLMKKVLNQSFYSNLDEILALEVAGQTAAGHTHDFPEGVMAFLQKRKANFKGK